jgi:oligopeptide/dipeptide ABC transporter ATP-binding protein
MSGGTTLAVRNLRKYFLPPKPLFARARPPVQAVDGIDLSIREGETLALVGESGSGKSTTGRLVLRLVSPSGGNIAFEGAEIDLRAPPSRAFRKDMQIVFQDPRASLNPRRTIYQALRDPLLLHGLTTRTAARQAVADLLERVGLAPAGQFIDRQPRQLSGGQLQRVCIARAISLRPRLIVADEPVSALDASVRAQILQLLRTIQQEEQLSFLFITHDLGVVRSIAQRVAVMYLGRIVEEGPVEAVFTKPAHPYTVALLSATPIPDPGRARARTRIALSGEIPSPANPPGGCRFHTRCPAVMDVCRSVDPRTVRLDRGTSVACHLHDPEHKPR